MLLISDRTKLIAHTLGSYQKLCDLKIKYDNVIDNVSI